MPFGLTYFLTIFAVNSSRDFAISYKFVLFAAAVGFCYNFGVVFVNRSEVGCSAT